MTERLCPRRCKPAIDAQCSTVRLRVGREPGVSDFIAETGLNKRCTQCGRIVEYMLAEQRTVLALPLRRWNERGYRLPATQPGRVRQTVELRAQRFGALQYHLRRLATHDEELRAVIETYRVADLLLLRHERRIALDQQMDVVVAREAQPTRHGNNQHESGHAPRSVSADYCAPCAKQTCRRGKYALRTALGRTHQQRWQQPQHRRERRTDTHNRKTRDLLERRERYPREDGVTQKACRQRDHQRWLHGTHAAPCIPVTPSREIDDEVLNRIVDGFPNQTRAEHQRQQMQFAEYQHGGGERADNAERCRGEAEQDQPWRTEHPQHQQRNPAERCDTNQMHLTL